MPKKDELDQYLDEMEETWQEDSEKGGTELPIDKYVGRVNSAVIEMQGDDDARMPVIMADYLVLEGPEAGNEGRDFIRTGGEWGRTFTRQWIEKLGFEYPTRAKDLKAVVAAIDEAKPGIAFKVYENKQGYKNMKILRHIPDDELPDLPEGVSAGGNADAAGGAEEPTSVPIDVGSVVGCKDKDKSDTTGEVVKVMGSGKLRIKTETGNTVSRDPEDVWIAPEEDDAPPEDGDGESDVGDLRAELEGFCLTHDIDFDEEDTDDDLKELIEGEAPFKKSVLVDNEVALLEQLEIEIEDDGKATKDKGGKKTSNKRSAKKPPEEEKPKKTQAELLEDLKALARSFQITVPRKTTLAQFRNKINKECQFDLADLEPDELGTLRACGVTCIGE